MQKWLKTYNSAAPKSIQSKLTNFLKNSNIIVKLPAPVKQELVISDLIIIRVYPIDSLLNEYPQEMLNRNVYAFNSRGELVWQIQEAPHGGHGEDKAYMDMRIENERLVLSNWIGTDYFVNLDTGNVIQTRSDVRPW